MHCRIKKLIWINKYLWFNIKVIKNILVKKSGSLKIQSRFYHFSKKKKKSKKINKYIYLY